MSPLLGDLEERVSEVVGWFASKPRSRLVAMKHLLQATHGSRGEYLTVEERELNHCINSIAEEARTASDRPLEAVRMAAEV